MTPDAGAAQSATVQPILITGGAGFIGCNLADRLAASGHAVHVYDSLSRSGVEANLRWLKHRHPHLITATVADIRDRDTLEQAAGRASAVFHFAAQVAVTTSFADPVGDFEVNLAGTVHLLDALRRRPIPVPLIFASTNKVYGDLADVALELRDKAYQPCDAALRTRGVSETRPLDFHTPYGCSKGAADQYVLDFGRSFGVPTAVMRMSCIYGRRQMGTEDQGWVAHFLIRALRGQPITIFGDGCQVRDILDVSDAVSAYISTWQRIGDVQGLAFNLGGGPSNAVSLRQLVAEIGALTGKTVDVRYEDWRPGDQRYYVSDTGLATRMLGLRPPRPWRAGLAALAEALSDTHLQVAEEALS